MGLGSRRYVAWGERVITRIEIDGFKSFEGFSLNLPPFAVILGPNAAGKSNLFDALRFLSRLATNDVRTAMKELRGEPLELFRRLPDGRIASRMAFAIETLLGPTIRDDFGEEKSLTITRLRYEITIVRREDDGIERFFVEHERAASIAKKGDRWRPYGRPISKSFRGHFFPQKRRDTDFLETVDEGDQRSFALRQDGVPGRVRKLPANRAHASVLSSLTVVQDFPHLYALRRELAGLRYLQLDAAAERSPSPTDAPDLLERDGRNVAAVLYRVRAETATAESPDGALSDIRADLVALVPGVTDLAVVRDEERREYRLEVTMRDGQTFNSRVLSDGTLRILSLLTLLHDPRHQGVLCFEEPENGVHQSRLRKLMAFLEEACTDPTSDVVEVERPFRQIIVNTHSSVAANAVRRSIIFASRSEVVEPGVPGFLASCTTMAPYELMDQEELFGDDRKAHQATRRRIEQFLEASEQAERAA